MAGEIKFSENYNDLSQASGTNAGFQFEFYCERCSDTWRTPFVPYRSGQASGWLGKAAGFFGTIASEISSAADGMAEAGWGQARDEAFRQAIAQAQHHFHRCGRCHQYVCDTCWNTAKGLCLNCAPDLAAEIEAARSEGEVDAATERARESGAARAASVDVDAARQLVCPQCGAQTRGAKFCPDCGFRLAAPSACPSCQAPVTAGVKFCGECGQKLTG